MKLKDSVLGDSEFSSFNLEWRQGPLYSIVLATDYDSFLIRFACTEDEVIVYVWTRNPNPSVKEIRRLEQVAPDTIPGLPDELMKIPKVTNANISSVLMDN